MCDISHFKLLTWKHYVRDIYTHSDAFVEAIVKDNVSQKHIGHKGISTKGTAIRLNRIVVRY